MELYIYIMILYLRYILWGIPLVLKKSGKIKSHKYGIWEIKYLYLLTSKFYFRKRYEAFVEYMCLQLFLKQLTSWYFLEILLTLVLSDLLKQWSHGKCIWLLNEVHQPCHWLAIQVSLIFLCHITLLRDRSGNDNFIFWYYFSINMAGKPIRKKLIIFSWSLMTSLF